MKELAPSILAADFSCLGEQISILEKKEVMVLHIDVMDGCFVPSISFGMPLIRSIRKVSKMFFDVHLMVQEPARFFQSFVEAGADSITIHAEACADLSDTWKQLQNYSIKKAIALKPSTPVEEILPYLSQADMILVMTVEPGFGGQKMMIPVLDKIRQLAALRNQKGYSYRIEIDGGVNRENISQVMQSGAEIIVAGTAVFQGNIGENVSVLKGDMTDAS